MSEAQSDQAPDDPTGKQFRDARRHVHGVQKDSQPGEGGDKRTQGHGRQEGSQG